MSAKFTPGPWKVEEPGDGSLWVTDGPPSTPFLIEVTRKGVDDQDRANARLIAAAPELYEALRLMRAAWDSKAETKAQRDKRAAAWNAAAAALAKVGA